MTMMRADYSYFEISGSLGQIAGVDASLTSLVLLMSLMHCSAAKKRIDARFNRYRF